MRHTVLNFFNYSFPTKPNTVCIDVNSRCNLRCRFCEIGTGIKKDFSGELTKKELFNIVDQLHKWKVRCINVISGGEPFIRRDIWDFLQHCMYKNIHIDTICTNGTLLCNIDPGQFKILSDSTDRLSVSLDSADSEKHDSFRGARGAYRRLLDGMKNINSLRKSHRSRLLVSSTTVINGANYNEIADIILLGKKISMDSAVFQPVNCMSNFHGHTPVSEKSRFLLKDKKELRKLKENIRNGIRTGKRVGIKNNLDALSIWIIPYFEHAMKLDKSENYFFKRVNKNFKCFVPFSHLKINSEGHILPCYLLPSVNNIRKTQIKTSWLKDINPARDHLKSGKFFEQCKTCYCDFPYSLKYNLPFYVVQGRFFFLNIVSYYIKRTMTAWF